jgi:hypothetical protein
MVKDVNELQATLVRYGYGTNAVAELLSISPGTARRFVRGLLSPERWHELPQQIVKARVPGGFAVSAFVFGFRLTADFGAASRCQPLFLVFA